MSEREMLDRLNVRYGGVAKMGTHWQGRKFSRAEHVPSGLRDRRAIADYVAVGMRADSGVWTPGVGSSHYVHAPVFHGHEVKVSRSDWLAELRRPDKAEWFRPYMNFWWLVVSDKAIVRDDLPEGWGLLVSHGRSLRVLVPAVANEQPEPMSRGMVGAILRATTTTETRLTAADAARDARIREDALKPVLKAIEEAERATDESLGTQSIRANIANTQGISMEEARSRWPALINTNDLRAVIDTPAQADTMGGVG